MSEERLSIVVRTIGNNKQFLERTIFSIYCSDYRNKEVVLVYQGQNIEFLNYLKYLENLYQDINFVIVYNNNITSDDRAKNLNLGIDKASGRYLAFLDDDDAVSQEHYKELIEKIKTANFVWGYANCCLNNYNNNYLYKKTYPYNKRYSFDALINDNFIPIHSFIIDLKAIADRSIIKSNISITRVEDYYMLLNLASRFMPIVVGNTGVFYNFYPKQSKAEDEKEFDKSREIINDLKREINLNNREATTIKTIKICYRILILLCYKIPFIGKKVIRRKKAIKFANDVYSSFINTEAR